MSINITSGGIIAVDPEVLRDLALRISYAESSLGEAVRDLQTAANAVFENSSVTWHLSDRTLTVQNAANELIGVVRFMADVFEFAELESQVRWGRLTEEAAAVAKQRMLLLMLTTPGLSDGLRLEQVQQDAKDTTTVFLAAVAAVALLPFGPGAAAVGKINLGVTIAGIGLRRIIAEERKGITTGIPADIDVLQVDVTVLKEVYDVEPPRSSADLLSRVPTGQAQVTIETYVNPDGTARYVAYIDGTRELLGSAIEPWDGTSNGELYMAEKDAASIQAVREALRQAGANPGDAVDFVGYSQGGMIAAALAASGEYAVEFVVTAGSPTEAVLPSDVVSVQYRHTDDFVAWLAAGGIPGGTGSASSIVVERTINEPLFGPHGRDRYLKTAEMLDSSEDPRAGALDTSFAALGGATLVSSTQYRGERKSS